MGNWNSAWGSISMLSALQHLWYMSTWFLGRSDQKQTGKDVINYLAMCIHRVLVLPVKKQDNCLTAASSLHETVSIIGGIRETNRRKVLTNKLSTSGPSRVFPVSGWIYPLSWQKIVCMSAVCCSLVLTVRAWNWNVNVMIIESYENVPGCWCQPWPAVPHSHQMQAQ